MKKIIFFLLFVSIAYTAFAQPEFVREMRQKENQTSIIDTIKVLETGKKGKYEITVMCIANKKVIFINSGNSFQMIQTGNECE